MWLLLPLTSTGSEANEQAVTMLVSGIQMARCMAGPLSKPLASQKPPASAHLHFKCNSSVRASWLQPRDPASRPATGSGAGVDQRLENCNRPHRACIALHRLAPVSRRRATPHGAPAPLARADRTPPRGPR